MFYGNKISKSFEENRHFPLPVQHQIVLNIEDIFGELAKIEEAVRN
jgi:hypothetical protein